MRALATPDGRPSPAACQQPAACGGFVTPVGRRYRGRNRRLYYSRDPMPRRSLKPELNKIRAWVRQGRTDAWIAHQLEVTVQQIEAFKRDQRLDADDGDTNGATPDHDDDLDLRAEDDAMIAAELDEAAAKAAEAARPPPPRPPPPKPPKPLPLLLLRPTPTTTTPTSRAAAAAVAAVAVAVLAPLVRWRRRSTTAKRATACGSTPPSKTIRSMPNTGPAIGPSRSRSRRIRSSSAGRARPTATATATTPTDPPCIELVHQRGRRAVV